MRPLRAAPRIGGDRPRHARSRARPSRTTASPPGPRVGMKWPAVDAAPVDRCLSCSYSPTWRPVTAAGKADPLTDTSRVLHGHSAVVRGVEASPVRFDAEQRMGGGTCPARPRAGAERGPAARSGSGIGMVSASGAPPDAIQESVSRPCASRSFIGEPSAGQLKSPHSTSGRSAGAAAASSPISATQAARIASGPPGRGPRTGG